MDTERAAIDEAIALAGGGAELARALGLQRQAIYQWTRIPPHHVLKIEALTGVSRHRLRPDIYPIEKRKAS